MKTNRWALRLVIASLVLAVAAFIALVFIPLYSGVAVNSETRQPVNTTETLIQMNGYRVLIPLAIPLVLIGVGWLALRMSAQSRRGSTITLWVAASLLLVFVLLTSLSIGPFYALSALLLLAAAVLANLNVGARRAKKNGEGKA